MRYRKKPEDVDAIQFVGSNHDELVAFCLGQITTKGVGEDGEGFTRSYPLVHSARGTMMVMTKDWVIRNSKGELEVCGSDKFEDLYEPIGEA